MTTVHRPPVPESRIVQARWATCPVCGFVENTHWEFCLCRAYIDGRYKVVDVVDPVVLGLLEAAYRIGGAIAAQAVYMEVIDGGAGGCADRGGVPAGVFLPT